MYYVYVLQSSSDKNFYTGYTNNLEGRINKHDNGFVEATKSRRPLKLVYYESSINKKDAINRELYLKTAWGKRFIKNRIKRYLENGGPS
ncbi:excinuclease ABC subunit C [Candidatus Woesebacteria bacterium RBG_16_39_8b]|uniref:Excinuclease ABC subunit C n=1 Tax=Candidatus Woesebacteria bacterium RBG_16_39_8b TaxID=1802482 RepID=A0A1F7XCI1_9BACT|nr:MAG: excinuclease ABC subunit C [Candidatus Woesebacteria bacterium RBG_16_39_8b]